MKKMNIKKKIDLSSFLLFVSTSLICLFVLEISMRWYMFGNEAFSYSQMKSIRHIGKSGLLKASPNLDILWELKSDLDTHYKLWPFKTNSDGLRDREYTKAHPPNTIRVAVIGDSLTMAEGVPIEEAYHSRLENKLNYEDTSEMNYEFINFGVAGYSLVQYVSTIKRKVLDFDPDLILIGFCGANDSKLPNLDAFKKPYTVKTIGNGFFHFYSLELLGNVYKKLYNKVKGRFPGYNADPSYIEDQFKELYKISKESAVPIAFAYIDNKAASADYDLVKDIADRFGFPLIDATRKFPKDVFPQYMIYLTDGHPNGKANEILADNIYPQLKTLFKNIQQ